MTPERVPVGAADLGRRRDDIGGRGGAEALGHAEGVHPVEEVASHQAVPSPSVDVEPGAAGDDDPQFLAVGMDVEESLEEALPSTVLMDLVEDHLGTAGTGFVGAAGLGHRVGPLLDQTTVLGVIPVQVGISPVAADRRLPHLTRTAHEGHLPKVLQVGLQDGIIDSSTVGHARQTTVNRILVKTILRYIVFW